MSRAALQGGWVELLNRYQWAWMATLTYKQNRTPASEDVVFNHVRHLVNAMNRRLYGRHWMMRGVGLYYFAAVEPHWDGRHHVHLLIGCHDGALAQTSQSTWVRYWHERHGIAQLGPIQQMGAAFSYCTKTAHQDGQFNFSKNLPAAA